jgi:hypothetical protein
MQVDRWGHGGQRGTPAGERLLGEIRLLADGEAAKPTVRQRTAKAPWLRLARRPSFAR